MVASLKTWTHEEVETLIANYNSVSNEQLCKMIPSKTPLAIYKKAYKMGLRKTAEIEFINRSNARKGEKCPNWKGGAKITCSGYRQILRPDHPRADSNGYVMEHVWIWEQTTGVSVPANCCIHHINGDKTDNRIQNLCMMHRTAHTQLHHTGAKRSAETRKKISERMKKYVE